MTNALPDLKNSGSAATERALEALTTGLDPLTLQEYIAIGANPAQSGAIRLEEGASIKSRNTAGDGDLDLIGLIEDNTVNIGGTTQKLYVNQGAVYLLSGDQIFLGLGSFAALGSGQPGDPLLGATLGLQNSGITQMQYPAAAEEQTVNSPENTLFGKYWDGDSSEDIAVRTLIEVSDNSPLLYKWVLRNLTNPGDLLTFDQDNRAAIAKDFEMSEMTEPAAPAADKARLYVADNGSGKTRLMVRFPSGASQVIATEP